MVALVEDLPFRGVVHHWVLLRRCDVLEPSAVLTETVWSDSRTPSLVRHLGGSMLYRKPRRQISQFAGEGFDLDSGSVTYGLRGVSLAPRAVLHICNQRGYSKH